MKCYYRVLLYTEVIQIMSGQGSYQLIHNPLAAFNGGESSEEDEQPTEGWPDEMSVCLYILCVCVCVCVHVCVCVCVCVYV